MIHWPHLSLVTFVPLVGTASILMARGDELVVARDARYIALWFGPESRTGSGPTPRDDGAFLEQSATLNALTRKAVFGFLISTATAEIVNGQPRTNCCHSDSGDAAHPGNSSKSCAGQKWPAQWP